MQNEHEASVDRLARQCRDREQESLRQRKQLEAHYNALIEEMESRAQVITLLYSIIMGDVFGFELCAMGSGCLDI